MMYRFTMNEYPCFVDSPATALSGNPWVWRTSFPEYHPEVDEELVKAGFHVAYIDVVAMLGSDGALDLMDQFYALVRRQWALAEKPALEAVSRGGLHAYRYAARHPERIACIFADTPVMDLKSWPLRRTDTMLQLEDAIRFYGFKDAEELRAFTGNPIDLLETVARAKIPLRHIISLNDEVVPPEENTLEARRRLNKSGWDIDLVCVQEGNACNGHHFPAVDIDQSVRFVMQHASLEETTKNLKFTGTK
jgi:sialidase-1